MKGLRRREWANGQVSASSSDSTLSAITTTSVNSPLSASPGNKQARQNVGMKKGER